MGEKTALTDLISIGFKPVELLPDTVMALHMHASRLRAAAQKLDNVAELCEGREPLFLAIPPDLPKILLRAPVEVIKQLEKDPDNIIPRIEEDDGME